MLPVPLSVPPTTNNNTSHGLSQYRPGDINVIITTSFSFNKLSNSKLFCKSKLTESRYKSILSQSVSYEEMVKLRRLTRLAAVSYISPSTLRAYWTRWLMRQSRSVDGSGFVGNIAWTLHTAQQTKIMEKLETRLVGRNCRHHKIHYMIIEQCNLRQLRQSPYLHKHLLSLWHHSCSPVLIMMSLATELATPTITDVRKYRHLTAFNI